ncbi:MAG: PDZ domain-containing protein, partial [Candidatus Eremiobacteraeota bacterium]|nr:PDZ domain-containing protein [Candidatus Eremiobacteraeota bacterium]
MKRIVPVVLAALLALATARVPAATAAASPLSTQQTEELVGSYVRLTADFYKKVDRQAVLDGARSSMIEYLKKHNVTASLPPLRATTDDESNAEALHREVSTAVTEYASKLTPVESISPSSQITYAAIAGVLSSVKDRYTTFLSPKEYAALNEGLDGTSFGGVGISYLPDDKTQTLHVENVILDGPSDKAGLQPEDAITAVDGKPVSELLAPAMTEKDEQKRLAIEQKIVSGVLRGAPGTRVRLTIQRNGKLLEPVTITRETIHAPSVTSKMLPGSIGYVDLSVFGQTTAAELTTALKRLDAQGAK